MKLHPFPPERQIGHTYQIEGTTVDVSFTAAAQLPTSYFGEYLGKGEVGQFVVIDAGGVGAFGRLLRVSTSAGNLQALNDSQREVPVEGRVQLLATLRLDGQAIRGILRYPRVGDPVYAASSETVLAVLGMDLGAASGQLSLGRLSVDESVEVAIPLTRLFGRHLAIVGATGSGKSWTLGHLAEAVQSAGGKMIVIDATGEFHTLAARARHLAFGSTADEPSDAQVVGVPHFMMRESDRNAFLNPSAGTQLPKLREAIRSLRLAAAIAADATATADHKALVGQVGTIKKAGLKLAAFGSAAKKYGRQMEAPHGPFDLRLIGAQIQHECVWPTGRGPAEDCFGGLDFQQIGYVSTLVSRVGDLVATPAVMEVIDPAADSLNAVDEIDRWIGAANSQILRLSLRNLPFTNHLREIVVNILGQALLSWARNGRFRETPLVVALDEAHQFFDVTVGDEFANARLNAFDSIAKEGRKYGLTVCVATQRPGDLPAGVLSQVGMTIVHRLADGRDRQRVEEAAAELDYSATRLLPGLVPGEAILMGVDFPVPVSVRIHRPIAPPESDGPQYQNWKPQ